MQNINILLLLAGLVLVVQACGGMRNVLKDGARSRIVQDSSLSLQRAEKFRWDRTTESLLMRSDSSSGSYQVQIWPKGKFTFSVYKGFEGSAERVLMLATAKQASEMQASTFATDEGDQQIKTALKKEGRLSDLEVSKSVKKVVSWKTLLGYALIGCSLVACFMLFRSLHLPKA
jgi:hypothetical protein